MCYPALEHLLCLAARNSWESSRKYNSAWCCTSSTNPLRPLMQLTIGRFCDINCAVTPNSFALRVISDILWRSSYESFWILETLEIFLWFTINYSIMRMIMFWSKLCKLNRICAWNLAFISCIYLTYCTEYCVNIFKCHESVYFKELHKEQEYSVYYIQSAGSSRSVNYY